MEDTHKEFERVREYAAPREAVFKAWTDPKLVSQWWGPEGVFTPVCEVDARVGGRIHIVMEAGETLGDHKGMQWPMEAKFVEIEEPSKIVFSSNAVNGDKETHEYITTVTFNEKEGKTTMTVHVVVTKIQKGMDYVVSGMEQGWSSQFDKLGKFLEK
jgi:uncharacterized protein YndB with AHSA1/START domain